MSERGDYIICDNGAFELGVPYEPSRLISIAEKCGANVIVLPDYPGEEGSATINAAERYAHEVIEAGFETMFVPQSKKGDMEDWINGYAWAANNPQIDLIGMSILGIPNALPHLPRSYARVVMTELLMDRNLFHFDKYHHYLGLNAGPKLEIPALIKMGAINSCDSSGPVWAGICGQMYVENTESYMLTTKIDKHVDFDYPYTSNNNTHRCIQNNVSMTLELFGDSECLLIQKSF